MTMTMVAGLALLLVIAGLITEARLLANTRRLERELASQRMKLGELLRENLDLRFPGRSQVGPRADFSPLRKSGYVSQETGRVEPVDSSPLP